jgi:2-polyprenyl-6-methoxyphenol hydroxylase-like FAD-dependent oxidoreductase
MEELDIVIVGGGIAGLATSLALHRKGIKSVVLERSESVRSEGAAFGIQTNGWLALQQLGVADKLASS